MTDKNYIYKKLSDGRYIKEIDNKVEHLATAQEDSKLATDIRGLLQGPQGLDGTSGTSGQDGTSGKDGQKGDIGRTGLTGPRGLNGTSGTSGSSGQDGTSGQSGQDGTSGINGRKGEKGDKGDRGFPGLQGPSGQSGSAGISGTSGTSAPGITSGTSGSSGTSSSSGTSGSSGSSGVNGQNGSSGTSGKNGSSGTSGTTPTIYFYGSTTYGATVSFTASEVVTYQQLIPANTFKDGDFIEFYSLSGYPNTTYSRRVYLYGSTFSSTVGSSPPATKLLLAQSLSGGNRTFGFIRTFAVYTANGTGLGTVGFTSIVGNETGLTTTGANPSGLSVDWTKDCYITIVLLNANSLDIGGRGSSYYIRKIN